MVLHPESSPSIVSLGSGFRGGLFFASLLLGALGGRLFAVASSSTWPGLQLDANVYEIIGIGALSASIIGAPLTATFIALESTGDFWLATAVLIAVHDLDPDHPRDLRLPLVRDLALPFARQETIRSAADVGWIRDLTVGRMMRPDFHTVQRDTTIEAFRTQFPLGSTGQVIAVDPDGHYAGDRRRAGGAQHRQAELEKPVEVIVHTTRTRCCFRR